MVCDNNAIQYLCNFDEPLTKTDCPNITKLWAGEWSSNDPELCKKVITSGLESELQNIVKLHGESNNGLDDVLHLAINSILTFCDQNWNPNPNKIIIEEYFHMTWPESVDVGVKLQRDSEPVYGNIKHPELLFLAHQLFNVLYSVEQDLVHLWWSFRSKVLHQRALEDSSATLYLELELMMAKLTNELTNIQDRPRLQVLLCMEIAQAYLMYGRIQKVEEYLTRARDIAGLKLELTGVLGKRTKFQQQIIPQLALNSELDASMERPSAEESHGTSMLPPDIELQDDVRLNKINYMEKVTQAALPSLEQILVLLTVQYMQKSQPKDELLTEELQPYLSLVVSQRRSAWGARAAALLARARLEAGHRRSVERAMLQCEAIVNDRSGVANTDRLSYLWATGLQPAWTWRQQLADLYLSLGLVKAALEEYQRLQLWEDVIVCYTILQLRHKAAEIIQQQIEINPTVKLYCLLGDATDDVSWYEKAWEFSEHKSSRAQRHWGNFLFERKKYADCIPHYETSLEINSIQEGVWLRLAFAALQQEKWETSAWAYRRYTYLQPHSFEAWNNLAKVYVNQGDKPRAYRALIEALRFNYDNWKLWENVVTVSMDTGHFEDVIRGCHRLTELVGKFDDEEVLALLVRAVLRDHVDADGNGAARLRKRILELFGRITSVTQNNPEIWRLYSELSPTNLLKAQRLLKAYRGYTQSGNWSNNPQTCAKVIDLALNLLEYSLKARQEAEEREQAPAAQQLSSARLTAQAVLRAAEKQDWPDTRDKLAELKLLFDTVTDYIKDNVAV